MTIDSSLKVRRGGLSNRSVLKRAERLEKMKLDGTFDESTDSPLGIPKTKVLKLAMKKKKKEKEEGDEESTEEG
ncbi:MAG: small basic protein [Pirellulales bacterium]|jgi:small basic protein (TIGR04137 family)